MFPDYLLSNNHVNAIIVHKFDFSDEEVMAYYISFLKTLSFRLNKHTIHFFYNEVYISIMQRRRPGSLLGYRGCDRAEAKGFVVVLCTLTCPEGNVPFWAG